MTDLHDMLLAEIGKLLRDEGDPAERYALAKALGVLAAGKAGKALHDLVTQVGSVTAAADLLEISPQAVSKALAKHGYESPRRPGRPKSAVTEGSEHAARA